MSKLQNILDTAINPALELLERYSIKPTDNARCMMLAIGLQESRFEHRFQIVRGSAAKGPARGFWQFESGGGVRGVLTHAKSKNAARAITLDRMGIETQTITFRQVWEQLEHDDILAAVYARLLLWTDSRPLPPVVSDVDQLGWTIYNSVWRPGKPHPQTWPNHWKQAVGCLNTEKLIA